MEILFLSLVGLLITLEHAYLGTRWENYEYARRAMGIITVMACAYGLVLFGSFDLHTWLWILLGFGLAGIIILAWDIDRAAIQGKRAAESEKQKIRELADEQQNRR